MTEKKSRAADVPNCLSLGGRQLPMSINCRSLDFVTFADLDTLYWTSKETRRLVDRYFAQATSLTITVDEPLLLQSVIDNAKRLQLVTVRWNRLKQLDDLDPEAEPEENLRAQRNTFLLSLLSSDRRSTLQRVTLAQDAWWSSHLLMLLADCSNLTELDLTKAFTEELPDPDARVTEIIRRCPKLTALNLGSSLVSDDTMAAVLKAGLPLKKLALRYLEWPSPSLVHLPSVPSLRELDVSIRRTKTS